MEYDFRKKKKKKKLQPSLPTHQVSTAFYTLENHCISQTTKLFYNFLRLTNLELSEVNGKMLARERQTGKSGYFALSLAVRL
jgi:hypothetical protein